jgi:diadenosine tetraphosphatase ApaH/serine/threonine PP2A family protein phosphatase
MDVKSTIVILSDIHANLDALERTIGRLKIMEITNPKKIICLGDVVGYGAQPKECTKIAQTFSVNLKGNHERYLSPGASLRKVNPHAKQAIEFTKDLLSNGESDLLNWLVALPDEWIQKTPRGLKLRFSHYAPNSDNGYVRNKEEAAKAFEGMDPDVKVTFVGHTHQAALMVKRIDGKADYLPGQDVKKHFGWDNPITLDPEEQWIVNVGSVGQPRDGDPRASAVLYDFLAHEIRFVRVDYDVDKTQQKIRDAGLPDALADRLATGK